MNHRRDIIEAADQEAGVAQQQAEPDPKKAEMIRDHAPHPAEVAHLFEEYEHLDPGRWKFTVKGGWYEDVVNGLWMEGYLIREVRDGADDLVVITVIEKRRLETGVCPVCGERNEPDTDGDSITCPDCGADF